MDNGHGYGDRGLGSVYQSIFVNKVFSLPFSSVSYVMLLILYIFIVDIDKARRASAGRVYRCTSYHIILYRIMSRSVKLVLIRSSIISAI